MALPINPSFSVATPFKLTAETIENLDVREKATRDKITAFIIEKQNSKLFTKALKREHLEVLSYRLKDRITEIRSQTDGFLNFFKYLLQGLSGLRTRAILKNEAKDIEHLHQIIETIRRTQPSQLSKKSKLPVPTPVVTPTPTVGSLEQPSTDQTTVVIPPPPSDDSSISDGNIPPPPELDTSVLAPSPHPLAALRIRRAQGAGRGAQLNLPSGTPGAPPTEGQLRAALARAKKISPKPTPPKVTYENLQTQVKEGSLTLEGIPEAAKNAGLTDPQIMNLRRIARMRKQS